MVESGLLRTPTSYTIWSLNAENHWNMKQMQSMYVQKEEKPCISFIEQIQIQRGESPDYPFFLVREWLATLQIC